MVFILASRNWNEVKLIHLIHFGMIGGKNGTWVAVCTCTTHNLFFTSFSCPPWAAITSMDMNHSIISFGPEPNVAQFQTQPFCSYGCKLASLLFSFIFRLFLSMDSISINIDQHPHIWWITDRDCLISMWIYFAEQIVEMFSLRFINLYASLAWLIEELTMTMMEHRFFEIFVSFSHFLRRKPVRKRENSSKLIGKLCMHESFWSVLIGLRSNLYSESCEMIARHVPPFNITEMV